MNMAFHETTEWFMAMPDPTNAQSAFVASHRVGAGAGWLKACRLDLPECRQG